MGTRPRSPSAQPAPCWGPQPGGRHPAKRPRYLEPQSPNFEMPPNLADPTGPQAAGMITVAILPAGYALTVPLGNVNLMLEPAPTSVLRVSLGAHTILLVPEALLHLEDHHQVGGQGPFPVGLEPRTHRGAPREAVALGRGSFCASSGEMATQGVVPQDANHQLPPPWMGPATGSVAGLPQVAPRISNHLQGPMPGLPPWAPTPSPERRSLGPYFSLRLRLLEPLPHSPLQPLPASPNPGPQARPQRPQHLHPKARRRLFLN
ncbi:PREDICTED: proline-rich protein 23A-like [Condylura cristata]|uniref:proline-rich protein 23A-like n=1 Tax=Condylura cristata TaxID=143302 RepID=UPI0003347B31|nr:PREDICTED: proline-rich protein 23A-like [Condylura cristata]